MSRLYLYAAGSYATRVREHWRDTEIQIPVVAEVILATDDRAAHAQALGGALARWPADDGYSHHTAAVCRVPDELLVSPDRGYTE